MRRTLASVSPGNPTKESAHVAMPAFSIQPIDLRYFSGFASLFISWRTSASPDSIPRSAPTQPLSAASLTASSSRLLQRMYESHRSLNLFLIIIRQMFLNRGKGTLNVSVIDVNYSGSPALLLTGR